jgi:hypothetical protein
MPANSGTRLKKIISAVAVTAALVAIGMGPNDTNWGKSPAGSPHAVQAAVIQQSVLR